MALVFADDRVAPPASADVILAGIGASGRRRLTLSKSFQIYERLKADLRLSAFNLPNHPVFSAPNVSVGSSAFGVVNGQANAPRQMEVSLKIRF